jgi:hypothetical protein
MKYIGLCAKRPQPGKSNDSMRNSRQLYFFLLLIMLIAQSDCAQQCVELREADSASLIAFLSKDKEIAVGSRPGCVTYALSRLGDEKSAESSAVVSNYLDFRRPMTADEKEMDRLHISMSAREFYPAVLTLFQIGKPALPALIEKIGEADASKDVFDNAIRALMFIFRQEPSEGIRFLKKSADESHDPKVVAQIKRAIEPALKWCGTSRKEQCQAVLQDQ